MKTVSLFVLLAIGALGSASAQDCPPQASVDINANHISARLLNGGDLFNTGSEGQFLYLPAAGSPSTLFNASFWIGGVRDGQLAFSGSTYRSSSEPPAFTPGPVSADTGEPLPNCAVWDRFFVVTRAEIEQFTQDRDQRTEEELIQLYPSIMGWPGARNIHFEEVNGFPLPTQSTTGFIGLAPFADRNGDGIYTPMEGDLPAPNYSELEYYFLPDQFAWAVMNDMGSGNPNAMGIQLEVMAWAFDCESSPVLKDVVFTNHRVRYLRGAPVLDCHLGLFVDPDLGCFTDDYAGAKPDHNTLFVYNQDGVDGTVGSACEGGVTSFGEATPVQTITFLDFWGMSYSAIWNGFSTPFPINIDDQLAQYRLMSGFWPDGLPFTLGGDGYDPNSVEMVEHLYTGDPADVDGWSMCTSQLPPADLRMLGSRRVDDVSYGFTHDLIAAWMVTPDAPAPCSIGNALDRVQEVQDIFDNDFQGGCGNLVGIQDEPVADENLRLYPNPATHTATVELEEAAEVRVVAIDGRVLFTQRYPAGWQELNLQGLPAGGYWVQAIGDAGVSARRLVVAR